MNRALPALLTGLLLLSSCALFRPPEQDAGFATRSEAQILFPEYVVSYMPGDTAVLHFRISQNNLLFTRNPEDTVYSAYAELRYRVMPSLDGKVVSDSSSISLRRAQKTGADSDWYGKIKLVVKQGFNGFLDLQFTDIIRKTSVRSVMQLDRRRSSGRDYYTLCRSMDSVPLFRNFLQPGEAALLKAPDGVEQVNVKYYRRDFPLPPPPFSTANAKSFSFLPDSSFRLSGQGGYFMVQLPARGFYQFQTDTATTGITLFRHADDFPYFSKVETMIPVLRFITTRQEYDELSYSANKEISMEDFWVRICGNSDRAKVVMSAYYGRAEQANRLFSSYTEGWRTDRGLVYVIFGQPNAVYRDPGTETWIYGEERSFKSLTFTFIRNDNPFTGNDYQLSRSELYKDEWYRGVDSWRQGRIYNDRP
jgi:GWxTD domain-containing protein